MSFQLPITITEVIAGIQSNAYVLPAIQREFVWNGRQIERLFDSLMRGYPIGSFLFWRVDPDNIGEFQFYRFMDRFHQKDCRHNEPINLVGQHNVTAVLDGQQRLTALNIGLRGYYADKLPWYRWNSPWAFPERRLHLNLLAPAEDPEFHYEFRLLRENERQVGEGSKFWYPVGDVLSLKGPNDVFFYCHDKELVQRESTFPFQTLSKLWEVITQSKLINYFREDEQDLDKVLNIFIRVNSGGTTLSYSDMLLSIATAQWGDKDARQEINHLVDDLNGVGERFNFNKDFVLKASLVLSDAQAIEFKVNSFTKQNMLTIERQWDAISRTLRLAVRLLASWGYSWQTLVANYALIPLAYYLHKREKRETLDNFVESAACKEERSAMRQLLMLTLLRRTFSGTPDNVLRAMRRVLQDDMDGFPLEAIKAALAGTPKSLAFDEAALEGLLGYQYDQTYTFSVLALLYPWLKYDQHFHKDHIFPRGLVNKKELRRRGIQEEQWPRWLDNVNALANLQLLQGLPNLEKSDREPMAWLNEAYPTDADKTAYRRDHLIPDIELTLENFPEFIAKREELILDRLALLLKVTRTRMSAGAGETWEARPTMDEIGYDEIALPPAEQLPLDE